MLHKLFILLLLGVLGAIATPAQEWGGLSQQKLEKEVFTLLRGKDVGTLAAEFARAPAPHETWPLLVRLNIYARAGHEARIQQTLEQLYAAPDMPPVAQRWVVAKIIRDLLPANLALQRFYQERLMPNDPEGAENFYLLWLRSGDTKDLDKWLAQCGTNCLTQRLNWRLQQGTADELLDQMAAELRAQPNDLPRLEQYAVTLMNAEGYAQHFRKPLKVSGRNRLEQALKEFTPHGAADYYALGQIAANQLPALAVEFLQQALAQPFTAEDEKVFAERYTRFLSVPPKVGNWPKFFRYQAKKSLAEIYQRLGHASDAQPIVQELVTLSQDAEMQTMETYRLAGQVQQSSGFRVVESKILQDEATRRHTSAYWLERVRYYEGRAEPEQAQQTFRQALVNLPYRANDKKANLERLEVLRAFSWFVEEDCENRNDTCADEDKEYRARCLRGQTRCREVATLLPSEILAHPDDGAYIVQLLELLENELPEVYGRLLQENPALLPRFLAAPESGNWEGPWGQNLIENVLSSEHLSAAFKENFVARVEQIALAQPSPRPFYLAEALRRAFPDKSLALLRNCQQMGNVCLGERRLADLTDRLFTAYCQAKNWQTVEELLFAPEQDIPLPVFYHYLLTLTREAVQRKDFDEAMRLWRLFSRYDRRLPHYLFNEIAATPAKAKLREFYLEMKQADPASVIPDEALARLGG